MARRTGDVKGIGALIGDASVRVAGEPRRVPEVVDLGAYRVVREALEGARGATSAAVAIEYMPGALAVQVEHDGTGSPLESVAELAARLGGGLTAAASARGFRVRAWLPTEGQPRYPEELLAAH
jgi:signal transduction histidine kinase